MCRLFASHFKNNVNRLPSHLAWLAHPFGTIVREVCKTISLKAVNVCFPVEDHILFLHNRIVVFFNSILNYYCKILIISHGACILVKGPFFLIFLKRGHRSWWEGLYLNKYLHLESSNLIFVHAIVIFWDFLLTTCLYYWNSSIKALWSALWT